jgi:hypothetical protein
MSDFSFASIFMVKGVIWPNVSLKVFFLKTCLPHSQGTVITWTRSEGCFSTVCCSSVGECRPRRKLCVLLVSSFINAVLCLVSGFWFHVPFSLICLSFSNVVLFDFFLVFFLLLLLFQYWELNPGPHTCYVSTLLPSLPFYCFTRVWTQDLVLAM